MAHIRIQLLSVLMTLMLFAGLSVAGEEELTIAVASDNQGKNGQISSVAARARYFLFFDRDGQLLETVANPHAEVKGGAGPQTANFLADKQVKIVVAGSFGTKMINALNALNIQFVEKQGNILDEIQGVIHAR